MRGSVVHKVLEDLFDLPALERTHDRASLMLGPAWERLLAEEPELAEMFAGGADAAGPTGPSDLASWLDQCRDLLERYFALEDPQRLEPAEREVHVVTTLDSGLTIHGYIDRLDLAPSGELRIVDYKTGASPGEWFEAKALFQMKFYALVVWRTRGRHPGTAAADLPRQRGDAALPARRGGPAGDRAQGARPCGRRSSGRPRPASGDRTSRGCATGATTRRSARPGAAHLPHCRSRSARVTSTRRWPCTDGVLAGQ